MSQHGAGHVFPFIPNSRDSLLGSGLGGASSSASAEHSQQGPAAPRNHPRAGEPYPGPLWTPEPPGSQLQQCCGAPSGSSLAAGLTKSALALSRLLSLWATPSLAFSLWAWPMPPTPTTLGPFSSSCCSTWVGQSLCCHSHPIPHPRYHLGFPAELLSHICLLQLSQGLGLQHCCD